MEKIKQILAVATVVAMVCASLVMVSPNITVMAEDSAKPLADLNTGYPGNLQKVAWHPDGKYALAVTGNDDWVWRYTRNTMSWSPEIGTGGGDVYNDIAFDSFFDVFYIVGSVFGDPVIANAWEYNPSGTPLADIGGPALQGGGTSEFNGLCAIEDGTFGFLAVGFNGTLSGPLASWYVPGFGWINVNGGDISSNGIILYDVTENQAGAYYAVGDNGGKGAAYEFPSAGWTTPLSLSGLWGMFIGSLYAIDWAPATGPNYAIAAGIDFNGKGNIWQFYTGGTISKVITTTDVFADVCWHPDGSMAMIVGENGANGVIYHYTPDAVNDVQKVSKDGDYSMLYGVDIKGWTSPSSGLIVGSAGAVGSYLSAADSGTTITVLTEEPHNFDIDMWDMTDAGMTSTINTQVDVEETYTFYSEVNYSIGGVDQFYIDTEDDVRIQVSAFYDETAVPGVFPALDDQHRTRAFVAEWSEGVAPGADTASMLYPVGSPGTDEFLLDSFYLDPSAPGDHYYIYINVTFGPQTRAAAGPMGGASTFIWDNVQSHNAANTWDFEIEIYDANFLGATNSTYEEFGVFQFTNISIAGNPSGNAPPGSAGVQLTPNSQITCSANRDYYVNVSIQDLARVGGGAPLLATNVAVNTTSAFATDVNSMINGVAVYFPGGGQNLSVWGNTSQAFGDWVVAAPQNSTTAHGPQGEDFQTLGPTEIEWWVDVPGGTAEGVYQSTITFRIGYY